MKEPQPSPIEQLKKLSEQVEISWAETVASMRDATYELVDPDFMTDSIMEGLLTNFWSTELVLMEAVSRIDPDILKNILTRTEEIAAAKREADMDYFNKHVYPKTARRAFWRDVLGIPYDSTADYEALMAQRKDV